MRRVTLLVEDETKEYRVNIESPSSMLCRTRTPMEIAAENKQLESVRFDYERFGLFTKDPKLDNYMSQCSGVIVVLTYATLASDPDRVNRRLQQIECRPLLVIVSECPVGHVQYITSTSQNFIVEYSFSTERPVGVSYTFAKMLRDATFNTGQSSVGISNEELIAQFQDGTLPLSLWDHYGRLRVVYLALKHHGYNNTIDPNGWLCTNWKKYKTLVGHGHLWNYSLTRFWVELISHARVCSGNAGGFKTIWKANPELQNGSLHKAYYSDLIFTGQAKQQWVPPDKGELLQNQSACVIN